MRSVLQARLEKQAQIDKDFQKVDEVFTQIVSKLGGGGISNSIWASDSPYQKKLFSEAVEGMLSHAKDATTGSNQQTTNQKNASKDMERKAYKMLVDKDITSSPAVFTYARQRLVRFKGAIDVSLEHVEEVVSAIRDPLRPTITAPAVKVNASSIVTVPAPDKTYIPPHLRVLKKVEPNTVSSVTPTRNFLNG